MNKSNKILFIVLICCLLTVAVVGIVVYMLNMPHRDVQHETSVVVSAIDLVTAYEKDEAGANQKYTDKALQITGIVKAVETDIDGHMVVVFAGNNPLSGVRCTLEKNAWARPTDSVTLKGRCTGYLSDVIIIDCVLLK